MGALDFETFKAMLLLRLGNRTELQTAGATPTDYYGIWVNQAYRQLCSAKRIPETAGKVDFPQLHTVTSTDITGVIGTPHIAVPNETLYVEHVFCTLSGYERQLDWCPPERYTSYPDRGLTANRGTPREWTRIGTSIYLYPTLDKAYTYQVWFRRLPPNLSTGQSTLIGAEWDQVILLLAAYRASSWMGDTERAKAARAEYLEAVNGLIGIYGNEEKDRNENLRPDYVYRKQR